MHIFQLFMPLSSQLKASAYITFILLTTVFIASCSSSKKVDPVAATEQDIVKESIPSTEKASAQKTTVEKSPDKTQVLKPSPINEEHASIEGPFKTPQDVTKTCLECHEDVGGDMLMTRHWLWTSKSKLPNGKIVNYGKRNMLNNCCISIDGNQPRCTSCHVGYGLKDSNFDFKDPSNIDCLVCHDTTGTYKKFPTAAGYPAKEKQLFNGKEFLPPNYTVIAKNVGKTSRETCGTCHFFGGGGNAVKHADLDNSLIKPSAKLDVHMGAQDMSCADCHKTEKHKISGTLFSPVPDSARDTHLSCQDCHADVKHSKIVGRHLASVACETCHIPTIARAEPTKVYWDWSTAGQDRETTLDQYGKPLWLKKKGSFKWNKNYVPIYTWSNGGQYIVLKGDKITLSDNVLFLNKQLGNISDPESKIAPFKIVEGKQPYDTKQNILITPKLFGETGFWKTFDWEQSAKEGMAAAGLDYSGSLGWVSTLMYWPVHHQVSPKSDSLKCNDCHGTDTRMDWKALGYEGDPKKIGSRKIK